MNYNLQEIKYLDFNISFLDGAYRLDYLLNYISVNGLKEFTPNILAFSGVFLVTLILIFREDRKKVTKKIYCRKNI